VIRRLACSGPPFPRRTGPGERRPIGRRSFLTRPANLHFAFCILQLSLHSIFIVAHRPYLPGIMILLIPTCNTHARIATLSIALLDRYWPDHPPLHLLHDAIEPRVERCKFHSHGSGSQGKSPWLGPIRQFLKERDEELFVLMLDDYALCAPPRLDLIAAAAGLMNDDPAVGLFPLSWYPASGRRARSGRDGMVTLSGSPILLQAAIWRRSWFLELAHGLSPTTSPWSFEAAATQRAKLIPRDICVADVPDPAYIGGHLADAFDKTHWPLPYHNLMHRGEPEERHEAFLGREGFHFPARGLGDTVARIAQLTGAARVSDAISRVMGIDCGCQRRRQKLNEWMSY
jgi:hypothetical protein